MARPTTWHVDDLAWTEISDLAIRKAWFKRVVGSEFTDGACSVELTRIAPGGVSQPHREPYSHVFYVLEGRGEVQVEGEHEGLRPGSVSPIRAGQLHSLRNTGGEDLVMLVIYHPPRN